ncbi:hypothetical protein ACR9YC_05820 [Parasphingorhabdus sp. DH2-15]|uniref:hypothetical protein n=1 Tax=Parasphingorhabdus sp. DH2-15 TaxID=3444112 RepID=UPI003F6851FE
MIFRRQFLIKAIFVGCKMYLRVKFFQLYQFAKHVSGQKKNAGYEFGEICPILEVGFAEILESPRPALYCLLGPTVRAGENVVAIGTPTEDF